MGPNLLDITLHSISLQLAAVYTSVYNEWKEHQTNTEEKRREKRDLKFNVDNLLEAYRATRRPIRTNPDTGKRYGSEEADAMIHWER